MSQEPQDRSIATLAAQAGRSIATLAAQAGVIIPLTDAEQSQIAGGTASVCFI